MSFYSDKKVTLSSGDTTGYQIVQESPRLLVVVVPSLAPNETARLSLLVAAPGSTKPTVTVRSAKSLAQEGPTTAPLDITKRSRPFNETLVAVAIGMLGATLMLGAMRQIIRRGVSRGSNFNNIGFVLLHRGLVQRATDVFNTAVTAGADAPHSVANYGLCLAIAGDFAGAEDYFAAAEFYASTRHEKAIVSFNRALSCLLNGNKAAAYEQLRTAISLSKEIKAYANYSKLFKDAAGNDPEIGRILAA